MLSRAALDDAVDLGGRNNLDGPTTKRSVSQFGPNSIMLPASSEFISSAGSYGLV